MSLIHQRATAVRHTLDAVRAAGLGAGHNTAEQIDAAREALRNLAAQPELFPTEQYPFRSELASGFYRLGEDADRRNALYVLVGKARASNAPHRHPSWALIAGVSGNEHNVLFERIDDGSEPGKGKLRKRGEHSIVAGDVLYMPAGDYHTIQVDGDELAVHLHIYGIGVDGPENRGAPVFRGPDSEAYDVNNRGPLSLGVQQVSLAQVVEAHQAKPLAFFAVDHAVQLPEELPPAVPVSSAEGAVLPAGLPADTHQVLVLIGDAEPVEVVAERLARAGYATALRLDPAELAAG